MGCTSSKENTNPPPPTLTDQNHQIITEQFRQWLKLNRPKADEYVLNHIISTGKQSTNIDDYRPIVRKALDLLSDRTDIKTISKLSKLVQKEVSLASPKKVSHTIDILKQTAEKLQHGSINFENDQQHAITINNEIPNTSENKHGSTSSTEPGRALKEALERARILFYKGKQAAIFANPNGGYDIRIIDEHDEKLQQDGNLLRSIIVTEVKMRPKPSTTDLPQFTAPPPPQPKLLDEREIGDDFRRSIDAALKGLEAIYHTSPSNPSEDSKRIRNSTEPSLSQTDIQPKFVAAVDDMNEIMLDTSKSVIGNPIPSNEKTKDREEQDGHVLAKHSSSPKLQFNHEIHSEENINQNFSNSINKIQEYHKTLSDSSLPPVAASTDNNTTAIIKSPSHNVTYTEIIQSESRDGEQSRRFVTESYDELPTKEDEQTTSLKVVTKSEFSNHPTSGEKIMEQTVQVITVKVRNETVTTTNPSQISPNEILTKNDTKPTDMVI